MDATTQHALALVVEERIATLSSYRRWFRVSPLMRRAMGGLEMEYRAELRSLMALKWRARGIARAARNEQLRKSEAIDRLVDGVIDEERFEGWREGQPNFNGAFDRW